MTTIDERLRGSLAERARDVPVSPTLPSPARRRIRRRRAATVALTCVAVTLVAAGVALALPRGGGASLPVGPTGSTGSTSQVEVTLVASGLAFDRTELEVPANEPFSIVLENRDDGVPENVAILTTDGVKLFEGEIVIGPAVVSYRIPALDAGAYVFQSEIHPTMSGALFVGIAPTAIPTPVREPTLEPSPTPRTEGPMIKAVAPVASPDVTVVAKDLSFTVAPHDRIAPDTPFTITLEIRDRGIPHGIMVELPDGTMRQGEVVVGPDVVSYRFDGLPAGRYTVACPVHPPVESFTLTIG